MNDAAGTTPAQPTVIDTVHVHATKDYDVVVGRGLLDEAGQRIRAALPQADDAALLITDGNVGPLYADRVAASISDAGLRVVTYVIAPGESSKNLETYGACLEEAARIGLTRQSTVVALGGGVTGDLAGFVAATYMRGCHFVQVPTSLLAMVDSSVGGKTAVDLPQGKNLVGAFYQPDLVLCDLDCLATLPPLYRSDGTGEVVKYGVMADRELFSWLERPLAGQEERIVARCVAIKRDVVEADEREGGVRKLLNLGHTVGHAIELLGDYRIPHGHAVAAGTAIMARACAEKGWCPPEDAARIDAMLRVHGLPTGSSQTVEALCTAAMHDKKRVGAFLDVVVVCGIGQTEVRRLSIAEFEELVALGCASHEIVPAESCPAPQTEGSPDTQGERDPHRPVGSEPLTATVEPGALEGTVAAISSKSAAHRMLICAALCEGPTRIRCTTSSKDIDATCACLRSLGATVERDGEYLLVTPIAKAENRPSTEPAPHLDCGESGSTLRFMLPVACALGGPHVFLGAGRLPERPLEPLRSRLVDHGCQVSPAGLWPLQAWGRLQGGVFDLPGNISSQYITGLLLALPLTGEGGCVQLHGVVESRPYIDLTLSVMRMFGVCVEEGSDFVCGEVDGCECCERVVTFTVAPTQRYTSPGEAVVEGDWSNAAFWLCAGALGTEPVTVTGLDLATEQGDLAVLDVLADLGARVRVHPGEGRATVCGSDDEGNPLALHGTKIDARDVPDLIPVLSMVAACAVGETRVVNAGRLRIKESDRLQTTAELLRSFGVTVDELPDGLVIQGRGGEGAASCLDGAQVFSHNDHRIAMAAAVAAGRAQAPVVIAGAEAVSKSYPGFFADLLALGGTVSLTASAGSCDQADDLDPKGGR